MTIKFRLEHFFLCESFREDLSPSIIHQRGIIIPGAAAAGGTAFVCCPDPYPAKQKKVPAGFEWIYFFFLLIKI